MNARCIFQPSTSAPAAAAGPRRRLLALAFGCFNGLRVVAYLPTLAAIVSAGHADQHSLFTWFVFGGANASMALWLLELNAGRPNRAVLVNAVNAVMCGAIVLCIAWQRWGHGLPQELLRLLS